MTDKKEHVGLGSVTEPKHTRRQLCPTCGDPMFEVDRVEEEGAVYIWYECEKDDCTESWLKKIERGQI